ncbi:MAG: class I SAM-dependent rRNA methyltransferase [Deltaproteobacteria bacterium]|nr:MAG: class I SAM-dependent rRNA methyltransferase [Deltaproteobacteria bacterium]
MSGRLVVNGYSERWLQQGFPWVYPKEVVGKRPRIGQVLQIVGPKKQVLGVGVGDAGFLAARVYRHDDGPLDRAWLWERLDRAAELRDIVVDPETTGFRLVHGENDGLPGLRVDMWGHYAVIILDSPAVAFLLDDLVAWLEARREPRGVYLCYRPDPRDTRNVESFSPSPGLIAGHAPTSAVRVTERGMAMRVLPDDGPDVGMYADMREVRAWMEPHWGGRSVLNTFSYTAAFSVAAALGGASEIVTVDLSEKYLDRAEENFVANEIDPSMHEFLAMDTFKALDRFRRQGREFDCIVLDPPSFSHSDAGTWSAAKDYPRLVASALRVLAPGGWLIAASNNGSVSPKEFTGWILSGLKRVDRDAQLLKSLGQGPDFPALASFPEGRYLKVQIWRVL